MVTRKINYNFHTTFRFSNEEKQLHQRICNCFFGDDTNRFAKCLRRAFKEFWLPLVEAREQEQEEDDSYIPNFDMWFEKFKEKQNG